MHAKYVSTANALIANVIADLAALISGAAIADLSSSCDKINTTLVSTIAPGWTLHDAAAPGSGRVLSAPDIDGLTVKYGRIYSPSATQIDVMAYEDWNAVAHTGTNASNNASISVPSPTFSTTAVNTYWLFATPRSFYIASTIAGCGLFEFTRDCSYLQGSTYPCFATANYSNLSSTAVTFSIPRAKNLLAAGDTMPMFAASGTLAGRNTNGNAAGSPAQPLMDGANVPYHEIRPIWIVSGQLIGIQTAILGKLYDVLELTRAAGAAFDTFSDGSNTYMIVPSVTCTIAFKTA